MIDAPIKVRKSTRRSKPSKEIVEHVVSPSIAVEVVSEEVVSVGERFCNVSVKKSSSYVIPSFKRHRTISQFVKFLTQHKTFSLGHIRRTIHNYLSVERGRAPRGAVMSKADGRDVEDMFDSVLFQHGTDKLPVGSYSLRPREMERYHRSACKMCSEETTSVLSEKCYFSQMVKCIEYGWNPPVNRTAIVPKYAAPVGDNYASVDLYSVSTSTEFDNMRKHGVIEACRGVMPGIINPLGSVIKGSDKTRAQVLTNITVVDQETLTAASELLIAMQQPKIKARVITDVSATGVNDAAYTPPFSYPSLLDGLQLVVRDCYLGKADVSRYFFEFPLSYDIRDLFRIKYRSQLWRFARCVFGFSPCPYYCSTFSAEFRRWLEALNIQTAHMMDDWLLASTTLEGAREKMQVLVDMFDSVGFSMQNDKLEFGQQLVFLGVLIDTVRMTLRFEQTQAKGMRLQLQSHLHKIVNGEQLKRSTIRSVCGKLNWYSEVLQGGRLHTRPWWLYDKYMQRLSGVMRNHLIADTQWWINVLSNWERNESSDIEYKIWSTSELLADPHSIYVLQSDASGTDGYGYYGGYYGDDDNDYEFVSKSWPHLKDLDELTSHTAELSALEDFVTNKHNADKVRGRILCWVTDRESAMYSVNKGRCFEETALALLTDIFLSCDVLKTQIVALWVPREENELADYLSHFAFDSDRAELRGKAAITDQQSPSIMSSPMSEYSAITATSPG